MDNKRKLVDNMEPPKKRQRTNDMPILSSIGCVFEDGEMTIVDQKANRWVDKQLNEIDNTDYTPKQLAKLYLYKVYRERNINTEEYSKVCTYFMEAIELANSTIAKHAVLDEYEKLQQQNFETLNRFAKMLYAREDALGIVNKKEYLSHLPDVNNTDDTTNTTNT